MNQLHIAIEALWQDQDLHQTIKHAEGSLYWKSGVLVEPFFSNTDTGEQQFCRPIKVAACQDHIILIRNYYHGYYVLYNSQTTDVL